MSSKSRRKNSSVTSWLAEEPYRFSFLQAVRILEYSTHLDANFLSEPVGRFTPPSSESIRFTTHQSMAFPSSEIKSIDPVNKSNETIQWEMSVNIMGLTGSMGVMPFHYSELILDRKKQRDESMSRFFDLFNHRTVSLFHAASIKYRLPIQYERHNLNPNKRNQNDSHTQALLSLIGLGTNGLSNRLHTKDEALIYYSGLLSQQVRTESGLKQILSAHFDIPVEIEQFVGTWQDLIEDVRTRLPDYKHPTGCNACLGNSAMLGKKGWFAQGKIYIILGPLSKHQRDLFAPGTSTLKALNEMVRLYVGIECDYEFKIRIKRRDIPKKLKLDKKIPPLLGWNAWLSYGNRAQDNPDELLDITTSASQLR